MSVAPAIEGMPPLTRILAEQAAGVRFEHLSTDARIAARHCVMDWFAVTLAGAREPLTEILVADAAEDGGRPQATLIGRAGKKVSTMQAALINGAAGHALDYDDVARAMHGHPTAPVLPGVLALAEAQGLSGRALLTAFVAGYETECRLGLLMGDSHYEAGFHATATVGSIGAAAAVANLLGLSAERTRTALGLAATQAAGLKSMFGTMAKPLHAGKAAANGLFAARLAQGGFTAAADALECDQGFAAALGGGLDAEAALAPPPSGFHVRDNLFKYHAACYLTHSPIEALRGLREQLRFAPDAVEEVTLKVAPGSLRVCNIEAPRTGLECKFSLRQTAAFALAGIDTARLDSYSDENAQRADLAALRERVVVDATNVAARHGATVRIKLRNAGTVEASRDVGVPAADLSEQGARLTEKFLSLAVPILGAEKSARLLEAIEGIEAAPSLNSLLLRAG
jgi:2-methylcitrate dehydratase PrpD